MELSRIWLAPLAALLAAGCTSVGPDYARPGIGVPAAWHQAADGGIAAPGGEALAVWWERLRDPVLSALVADALAGSLDLKSAQARLRQARAQRALASAQQFPTLSASASGRRATGSEQVGSGATSELYSAGFDARWEPDVFGGVSRGIEAAQAELEASEANLQHARVSLVAEVALNYVELRAFEARLAIARSNLAAQAETYQLTDWRVQAGLVGALELEQAGVQLAQTKSQIPGIETGRAQAEHRLAVLLGQAPGALAQRLAASAPIPAPPARVAVGIPADTLRQRPDVRAAERTLAAETARIGVAEAARYPGFTLSGSIGLEALGVSALGASGATAASIAAGIAAVVFDGGRLRAQVDAQSAVAERALVGYEAAILAALQDVEDALVSLDNSVRRAEALGSAVASARNAAQLARLRYDSGIIDFFTLLDTQRTLLAIEDSLAATQAERASALIRLYKALGGGWESS
ncbi:MAG: efflux transporter outer membrane subunit [Burkholderiales bacterium]